MTVYKAPDHTPFNIGSRYTSKVFLAGSIEMGAAEHWQLRAGRLLSEAGFIVLDPRRDDWDSSWEQSIENENFAEQVRWELLGLEKAKAVLVHFDPATKSPITLLELGMLSQSKPRNTFVSCPEGYWRRGNVEILCERYKIPLFDNLDSALGSLIKNTQEVYEAAIER